MVVGELFETAPDLLQRGLGAGDAERDVPQLRLGTFLGSSCAASDAVSRPADARSTSPRSVARPDAGQGALLARRPVRAPGLHRPDRRRPSPGRARLTGGLL